MQQRCSALSAQSRNAGQGCRASKLGLCMAAYLVRSDNFVFQQELMYSPEDPLQHALHCALSVQLLSAIHSLRHSASGM